MSGLIQILINAIATGCGTAVGSYFATKYIIEKVKDMQLPRKPFEKAKETVKKEAYEFIRI